MNDQPPLSAKLELTIHYGYYLRGPQAEVNAKLRELPVEGITMPCGNRIVVRNIGATELTLRCPCGNPLHVLLSWEVA